MPCCISAKRERGTCSSSVGIKANELEDRVLIGLKDILLGNEDLIETFTEEFKAEVLRLRKQHRRRGLGHRRPEIRREGKTEGALVGIDLEREVGKRLGNRRIVIHSHFVSDGLPHRQAEQRSIGTFLPDEVETTVNLMAAERRCADESRDAPINGLDDAGDERAVIRVRQRRAFAGGAEHDHRSIRRGLGFRSVFRWQRHQWCRWHPDDTRPPSPGLR